MGNEIQWEGHNISVDPHPTLKYLLIASETVVKVDGVEICRSDGFRLTEILSGQIPHAGKTSELALEINANMFTVATVPYKLAIDGNIISEGKLKIRSWAISFIPAGIILLFSSICIFGLLIIS